MGAQAVSSRAVVTPMRPPAGRAASRGAFEEPNHLAPHEDRPSATEASPSNDRMRLSSIFHRIVADNDTQSLNLEVTPFISGVSSATSCFEFEDKKNGRIGRPSEHTAGTHVGPRPFSGAVLSRLFHTTASNEESSSVRRPDESGKRQRSRRSAWNRLGDKYIVRIAANAAVNAAGVGSFFWRSFAEPPRGNGPASIGGADE